MEKILLNISYQDNTRKYWSDSRVKNKIVIKEKDESIHKCIARVMLAEDYAEMSYKGKPISNIFIDDKDGNTKAIGYVYRVKQDIYNDDDCKYHKVNFDAWVDIKSISDYPIKELI